MTTSFVGGTKQVMKRTTTFLAPEGMLRLPLQIADEFPLERNMSAIMMSRCEMRVAMYSNDSVQY